jgi:hypothetical protein
MSRITKALTYGTAENVGLIGDVAVSEMQACDVSSANHAPQRKHGRVVAHILDVFAAGPDAALTVADIAMPIYGVQLHPAASERRRASCDGRMNTPAGPIVSRSTRSARGPSWPLCPRIRLR